MRFEEKAPLPLFSHSFIGEVQSPNATLFFYTHTSNLFLCPIFHIFYIYVHTLKNYVLCFSISQLIFPFATDFYNVLHIYLLFQSCKMDFNPRKGSGWFRFFFKRVLNVNLHPFTLSLKYSSHPLPF